MFAPSKAAVFDQVDSDSHVADARADQVHVAFFIVHCSLSSLKQSQAGGRQGVEPRQLRFSRLNKA